MSVLDGLRHRVYVLLRGERYAEEQAREVRFHLELSALAESGGERGARDVEVAARQAFGNVTYYREEMRRMSPLGWLDRLRQDLSYAARGLRRSPGFTTAVVATLGLGLGVNAAMFSFLEGVFVRPPSGVVEPAQIRRLYVDYRRPREPRGREAFPWFSYPYYRAIRQADSSIAIAAATEADSGAMSLGDARIPIRQSLVTANYFQLLGVRPQRGRFFAGDEGAIETPTPVAVISDALWHSTYAGDPGVLGKQIVVDARPYTIIGVGPRDFSGIDLSAVDVWMPANSYPGRNPWGGPEPWYDTFGNSFQVIVRAANPRAEARVATVATSVVRNLRLEHFEYDSTATVLTGSIMRALGPAKRAQELSISTRLAGVAVIVFLIACANAANLLLVRATRRRREFAMRRALGASVARLYGQVLTESVLLGVLGGVVAVLLAFWAAMALRRLLLPSVHWASGAIDLTTILFVSVTSVIVGLSAGLAPAMHGTRPDVTSSLKSGTRESVHQHSTLRSSLLVLQTALSIVLLVGAGLFVRSLNNVRGVNLGYDTEHTIVVRPTFATTSPPRTERAAKLAQMADRMRRIPGVDAVATASVDPMRGSSYMQVFLPDRDSLPKFGDERMPSMVAVSPSYFRATGIRLLAGRDFTSDDRKGDARVLIVSRSMAHAYWPGESALGKCVLLDERSAPCATVVGVVSDVHRSSVIEKPLLQYYVPAAQASNFVAADKLIIRARTREIASVQAAAAAELRRVFPNLWSPSVRTIGAALEGELRPWRLGATLFTAFGLLALIVAAVGVYSVMAYSVSQRMQEMGVRVALGARLFDILRLVVFGGMRVVAIGVGLGIAASLALGQIVASLLFGVSARDPSILIGAAAVLAVLAVVACMVPGWRAARVDPVSALRAE